MKEINLGPVARADGQPSDTSLQMMGWTRAQWDAMQRTHYWSEGRWKQRPISDRRMRELQAKTDY